VYVARSPPQHYTPYTYTAYTHRTSKPIPQSTIPLPLSDNQKKKVILINIHDHGRRSEAFSFYSRGSVVAPDESEWVQVQIIWILLFIDVDVDAPNPDCEYTTTTATTHHLIQQHSNHAES